MQGGLLRIDNAGALGSGNLSLADGGVLGLGAGDLTTRTVGTGAGQVQWTGSGGFAAFGADRTVRFTDPVTTIAWTAANFIGNWQHADPRPRERRCHLDLEPDHQFGGRFAHRASQRRLGRHRCENKPETSTAVAQQRTTSSTKPVPAPSPLPPTASMGAIPT